MTRRARARPRDGAMTLDVLDALLAPVRVLRASGVAAVVAAALPWIEARRGLWRWAEIAQELGFRAAALLPPGGVAPEVLRVEVRRAHRRLARDASESVRRPSDEARQAALRMMYSGGPLRSIAEIRSEPGEEFAALVAIARAEARSQARCGAALAADGNDESLVRQLGE